jgi:hypothetical protein
MHFLDFVQDTCLWFPEEGTVNLESWSKVGDGVRVRYTGEGLEYMLIFSFGLWSKDYLGPTPSHKERFSSSVFEQECGTHLLKSVIKECKRQYPRKEQNGVGG